MFTEKSCTVHNLKMLLPWYISVSLPRIKSLSDNRGIGTSSSSWGGGINWIQKYLVDKERKGIGGIIKEIFCTHLQRYFLSLYTVLSFFKEDHLKISNILYLCGQFWSYLVFLGFVWGKKKKLYGDSKTGMTNILKPVKGHLIQVTREICMIVKICFALLYNESLKDCIDF